MKVAIISGTSINGSEIFADWALETLETPYGRIEIKRDGELALVNRHGFSNPMPPHRSNCRAYVFALKSLGVEAALVIFFSLDVVDVDPVHVRLEASLRLHLCVSPSEKSLKSAQRLYYDSVFTVRVSDAGHPNHIVV